MAGLQEVSEAHDGIIDSNQKNAATEYTDAHTTIDHDASQTCNHQRVDNSPFFNDLDSDRADDLDVAPLPVCTSTPAVRRWQTKALDSTVAFPGLDSALVFPALDSTGDSGLGDTFLSSYSRSQATLELDLELQSLSLTSAGGAICTHTTPILTPFCTHTTPILTHTTPILTPGSKGPGFTPIMTPSCTGSGFTPIMTPSSKIQGQRKRVNISPEPGVDSSTPMWQQAHTSQSPDMKWKVSVKAGHSPPRSPTPSSAVNFKHQRHAERSPRNFSSWRSPRPEQKKLCKEHTAARSARNHSTDQGYSSLALSQSTAATPPDSQRLPESTFSLVGAARLSSCQVLSKCSPVMPDHRSLPESSNSLAAADEDRSLTFTEVWHKCSPVMPVSRSLHEGLSSRQTTAPADRGLSLSQVLQKCSPAVLDRLIGRHIGEESVDIFLALWEHGAPACGAVVWLSPYLSPADFVRMSGVCRQWRAVCLRDAVAIRQRRHCARLYTGRRHNKENSPHAKLKLLSLEEEPKGLTRSSGCLGDVQRRGVGPAKDVTPKSTASLYDQTRESLRWGDTLHHCPFCQAVAKVKDGEDRGRCQSPRCGMDFCRHCHAPHPPAQPCKVVIRRPKVDGVFSRKSKKNLRRLAHLL